MSELTVITNHVPRDIIDAWELSPSERLEFDYLNWTAIDEGSDSASFVRYKGDLLDLGEFERWDNPSSPTRGPWDGMRSDTFFSGVLVRFVEDFERVIVGRYYS